jgi:hypothetical protein
MSDNLANKLSFEEKIMAYQKKLDEKAKEELEHQVIQKCKIISYLTII